MTVVALLSWRAEGLKVCVRVGWRVVGWKAEVMSARSKVRGGVK